MLDSDILNLLICPSCRGELTYEPDASRLICPSEKIQYPVEQGIAKLMCTESKPLESTDESC